MRRLRIWAPICFFVLLFCMPIAKAGVGWLAFGDLRGKLEPCGCNPNTDLGGLRRLGVLVFQERSYKKDLMLLSLGSNLALEGGDRIVERHILGALESLKLSASLVGEGEYRYLQSQGSKKIKIPWVLTNSKQNLEGSRTSVLQGQIRIFGFLEHPSLQTAREFLTAIKALKKSGETSYLLYSGSDATLSEIIKSAAFETIITSNKVALSASGAVSDEREHPEALYRQDSILMTPLGSAGVLRGGDLATSTAANHKSLVEEFSGNQKNSTLQDELKSSLLAPFFVSWLDNSYERDSVFDPLLKKYKKARDAEFDRLVKWKKAKTQSSPVFAGAEACKACHPGAYSVWKASSHSRALETLEQKHQDKNAECVGCHVVGFNAPGGFVSKDATGHLAGVQCENCHGARAQHVKDPKAQKASPMGLDGCESCHHSPHSSHFLRDDRWAKIKHEK